MIGADTVLSLMSGYGLRIFVCPEAKQLQRNSLAGFLPLVVELIPLVLQRFSFRFSFRRMTTLQAVTRSTGNFAPKQGSLGSSTNTTNAAAHCEQCQCRKGAEQKQHAACNTHVQARNAQPE